MNILKETEAPASGVLLPTSLVPTPSFSSLDCTASDEKLGVGLGTRLLAHCSVLLPTDRCTYCYPDTRTGHADCGGATCAAPSLTLAGCPHRWP